MFIVFLIKVLIRMLVLTIQISLKLFKEVALLCLRLSFAIIFIFSSIFFFVIFQFLTFFFSLRQVFFLVFLKIFRNILLTFIQERLLTEFSRTYPRSYVFILFYFNVKKRRNVLQMFLLLVHFFLLVKLSEINWFLFFFSFV